VQLAPKRIFTVGTNPSNDFLVTKDSDGRISFVAEISTLQINCWEEFRAFDDSCDVALHIRSAKTGKEEIFYLLSEQNHDGETVSWTFIPANRQLDDAKIKLVIYND